MVRIRRKVSKDSQEEGVEVNETVEVQQQQQPGQDQEMPSSDNKRTSVKDRIKDIEKGKGDDDDNDGENEAGVVECKPTEEEEYDDDDDDEDSASQPSLESYQQKKELMGRLEEALAQLPKELREEAVDRFIQDVDDANERAIFVRPLLMHSYHLPGYNWKQDWWQYLSNNHPLFGIFCHHRHHPLKSGVRVASLVGSILFGLAITNIIYLAFVFTDYDPDQEYFSVTTNVTRTGLQEDFDQTVSTLSVTSGNVALWTVGALIHGFYDNCIWALAACSCLVQEGSRSQREQERLRRYQSSGAFLVNLATIVVVAIATFACMLRAALAAGEDDETTTGVLTGNSTSSSTTSIGDSHQVVYAELQDIQQNQNFQDYDFVVSYLVELVLNYLVYYPLVGTILFTGVLNCCGRFKFPVLGGRPYELKQLQEKKLSEMEDPSEEGIEVEWNDEETGGGNSPPTSSSRLNNHQQDSEVESCTGSADAPETPKEEETEKEEGETKPKK